jgi:hypothetical protein
MYGAKKGFSVPTHALRGYKSGYSETTHENTGVTYVLIFFSLLVRKEDQSLDLTR